MFVCGLIGVFFGWFDGFWLGCFCVCLSGISLFICFLISKLLVLQWKINGYVLLEGGGSVGVTKQLSLRMLLSPEL